MKISLFSVAGNILEMYDFILYGLVSYELAQHFFASYNAHLALIATLATLASGFVMRPLGGIIFGLIGDQKGRKNALIASMSLTAVSTFSMGILPSYEKIGIIAPLLLIICRLVQGIGVGGEFNGASVFLVEHFKKRNYESFAGGLIAASGAFGALAAVAAIHVSKSCTIIDPWRIPFLIGGVFGFISIFMRATLEESPEYRTSSKNFSMAPLKAVIKDMPFSFLRTLGIGACQGGSALIIFVYLSLYLKKLGVDQSFHVITCLVSYGIATPFFGFLGDIFGKAKIMKMGAIVMFISAIPIFLFLASQKFMYIFSGSLLLSIVCSFFIGPAGGYMNQLFPTSMRYTGVAFGYCLGAALLGGPLPMICEYFINTTQSLLIPAYYLMMLSVIGYIAVFNFTRIKRNIL